MAAHQRDEEFLRTRRAVAAAGIRLLGLDHLAMVDRLTRKDDSGREFGTAEQRKLACAVAAGSALVRCAEIASRLAPGIDWASTFTAGPSADTEQVPSKEI